MKIAHITVTFPPYRGGTGNVCFNNARELVRLGHDVHVFTAKYNDTRAVENIDGIEVHRLRPLLRYGNAALCPNLVRPLSEFDILHLHSPFYGGAEFIQLLKLVRNNIPLVITHHQDAQLYGAKGWISKAHDRVIGRTLLQNADAACFTSLDYAQNSQFADLVHDGKIRIVELPNGVDPVFFSPAEASLEVRNRFDLGGRRVVLFVGALDKAHHFKGIPIFLKAVSLLATHDLKVLIVGKGDLVASYRELARDLGLQKHVNFVGSVPDSDLVELYRVADVTVLPSVSREEAFGLVLLESMACGTTVIASNLPGVRSVVDDGQNGFLVEPGNPVDLKSKLDLLFSLSESRRIEMGTLGRCKVEKRYSWQQIGSKLQGLYEDALV